MGRPLRLERGERGPATERILTWRDADADDYWDFLTGGAGAGAMVLNGLEEHERARVRQEIERRPSRPTGEIALPVTCLVVSAS